MDIADIATQEYVEVDADERLGAVLARFEEDNPKGIVVTGADTTDGTFSGVITQRQLLRSHIEDNARASSLVTPESRSVPKLSRTEDVRDAARQLVEAGTMVAPVFENDSFWGILSADDLLETVLENLDALTVGQIYSDSVVTVEEDDHVGLAINRLREHGISRLPVVDDQDHLAGIVTTNDLVNFVTRHEDKTTQGDRSGELERMLDLPVYDLMSSPVETTTADASVEDAVAVMLENDYAGLVVTPEDDDRVVAGVVTKTDVLRALSYTEEQHMDVQITNIDLLGTVSRQDVRENLEALVDKYSEMQVRHAHVRLHQHKEKLRGTPLIQCQVRLRTDKGQVMGSGEGYGADNAFHVALDVLERRVLELKGIQADEEYRGQLLRKLNEL